MNRLQFSEKEKAIVQEVQRKNFWSRALPITIGSMLGCRFLMFRGYIGQNRAFAKVLGFGFVGYLFGKANIPLEIRERLLKECPDGVFAKAYNLSPEERNNFLAELSGNLPGMPQKDVEQSFPGEKTVPALNTSPSGDIDGLEHIQQPQADSKASQPVFSYAEQRTQWNKSETGTPPPVQSSTQPEFSYAKQRSLDTGDSSQPLSKGAVQGLPTEIPVGKVKRNKYGDEME